MKTKDRRRGDFIILVARHLTMLSPRGPTLQGTLWGGREPDAP